ncbi:MAG: LysR family transcriptional regulator [Solobacterium sp.]|nr:LysR family transcriptional regulator [Solobacterium sp.]
MIDSEKIQAFLSVVEYGNITNAANAVFTTQSHLSKQIRSLEEEVGTQLIIRSKGHSEISLTPQGIEFLGIARKWEEIMDDFKQVRYTSSVTEVSIGALERFNSFTLRDFYRDILKKHKNIRIDSHTRHSREIYTMMENRQLDLGLVSLIYPVNNIRIKPLFSETMYVISSPASNLPPIINSSDLNPELEIYSRWSDDFEVWHDQLWPGKEYRLYVGTCSMTPFFLDEPGRWAIVPVSALHSMKETCDFTVHRLAEPYPAHKVYLLEQKNPNQSRQEAVNQFRDSLIEYLENRHLKL